MTHPDPASTPRDDRTPARWPPILAALLLNAGYTGLCTAAHSPLAVTFGGLIALTLTLPPLTVAPDRPSTAIAVTLASILSVSAVWLTLPISWLQWTQCVAPAAAFAFALSSAARALDAVGARKAVSAAITVIAGIAWLTWPIWLSPWLAGHETIVNWLVLAHPPLTLNGVLIDTAIWTERPHMYAWTALNQDVSYSMPTTVLWCVLLHLIVGGVAMSVTWLTTRLNRAC